MNQKLNGWYIYRVLFIVMFIVGTTNSLKNYLTGEVMLFLFSILILLISIVGFWVVITRPVVCIIEQKIYLYEFPFLGAPPSHELMINNIEDVVLIRGHLSWKIQIRLQTSKIINYSPSQLETELIRIIEFINKHRNSLT